MTIYRGSVTPSAGVSPSGSASKVDITDSGEYFTATTVEGVLQELGALETELVVTVYNDTGSDIAKLVPVHIESYNTASGFELAVLADASSGAKNPATGVTTEIIANGSTGVVIIGGILTGVDTSAFSQDDELYVSATAGTLTTTRPTGATDQIQDIARVLHSSATVGVVEVTAAGMVHELPNLTTNKYWEGAATTNLPTEVGADDIMANVTATGIDAAIAVATLATGSVFYGVSSLPVAKDIYQVVTQSFVLGINKYDTANVAANGQYVFVVPDSLNGCNLTNVNATVATNTFSSGTFAVDVYNLTDAADMLSTALTFDAGELTTTTATTPAVINAATDDVATNDIIQIDITSLGGGGASAGMWVTLEFLKP